jgi:hypothetical protein
MPSFGAFCLNEPSERFINFASFDTGVLAFECIFNSLISDAVYSLLAAFLFAAFLATSISDLIRSGLITRSHSSSSELMRTDDHEHLLILSLDHEPALDGSSLCSGLVYTSSRAFFLLDQTPSGFQIRARLSREPLSRIGSDSWEHEPNPCRDLKGEVESKGCLISDFGIVSSLRGPMLKHDASRVLHNEQPERTPGPTQERIRC